jgi:hypothetical protein
MLYDEDRFLPIHANEYNENHLLNDVKTLDRGYGVIRKQVNLEKGGTKLKKIGVYASGDTGSNIRDAITGCYYKSKVGSADEDYFFTVRYCTGDLKTKNGSTILFFDSPESCQEHLYTILDRTIVENWEQKRKRFFAKKATEVCKNTVIR